MASHINKSIRFIITMWILGLILSSNLSLKTEAEQNTQIILSPEKIDISIGESFTLTINATNVESLYTWQVVLKYNGSIINCTDVWIPENNVFAGHNRADVSPEFDRDYLDGLHYIVYSCNLIGDDKVDVANGILFRANFTVIGEGSTSIIVATKEKPAKRDQFISFKSLLMDYDFNELTFNSNSCIIKAGGVMVNLKPHAYFTVQSETVEESGYVVLRGYKPVGIVEYSFAYKGIPVTFDASKSEDPDGVITAYIWDFGDGNVTITKDPIVVHVYNVTGQITAKLVVKDNGNPPLESDPHTHIVVLGLLLKRFDWSPYLYALLGIIVVLIAIYSVKKVARKAKGNRKNLK
ncbi:MAG: PKD domain-containing protein [Candidatus Bathyarchaeia archaeon]